MLKIIENDMFNISKRIKRINKNYCLVFNLKTKNYELYFKNGFSFERELVLNFDFLDFRTIKKVIETRTRNLEKLIKKIEEENKKLEEKNIENLKDESISKIKMLLKKGV